MTATAAPGAPAGVPTSRQVAGRRWRSARGVVAVVLALVALAVVIASLQSSTEPQYLDPESPSQGGTRALAQILQQRDVPVHTVRDAEDAVAAARPGTVLVIVRSERLVPEELDLLATVPGDVLLVEPTRPALQALAPGVHQATTSFDEVAEPGCGLDAAVRAGAVHFRASEVYESPAGAVRCYADDGLPRLVRLQLQDRTVTVLGSGAPLTNDLLEREGNAALAMNLVGAGGPVVWLIPDLPEPGSTSALTWQDLVPPGVWLFVVELGVAVLLVALWRMRRMGPVVAESLPVVVRSAETVEGRSRLYRAHRARDRAADALRSGARDRLVPLLGLPRGAAQDPAMAQEIVSALARRTGWDEPTVGAALYGPEPADDAGLVALTDFLDDLERQVRQP
ncbi:DUF4350 domain-containing protein [Thermomonospora cellulosilytica]|uniref:DUF4350 domain-containing protein n=1 Tax=Thermomonospora cellulosilytica TaxID=1411118 RepID=A0A7W3RCJ2_9ACTN|nr:DUF4350 domain-containing protein [Thermomonospora cellulosilytica]MBA9007889.1 hypothetical protein [Thermomonospora cellulosilytica]